MNAQTARIIDAKNQMDLAARETGPYSMDYKAALHRWKGEVASYNVAIVLRAMHPGAFA